MFDLQYIRTRPRASLSSISAISVLKSGIRLNIAPGFEPTSAGMALVGYVSLKSGSALDRPNRIRIERKTFQINDRHINFVLPALWAAVVVIRGDRIRTYGLLLPKQAL